MALKPDARITDILSMLADPVEYVRGIVESVIKHSFDKERCAIRIGVTGTGVAPNYSNEEPREPETIEMKGEVFWTINRERMVFNGRSHRRILEDFFEEGESWSSVPMTFAKVQAVLGDLRRFKKSRS